MFDHTGIDVHGEIKKFVVTLWVMRHVFIGRGTPRACVDFCDPTAGSRLKMVRRKFGNLVRKVIYQNQPAPKSFASFQSDIHKIFSGKFLRLASIDFSRLGPTLVMSPSFDNVPLTLYDATIR